MAKDQVIKPGHFKLQGRERPGKGTVTDEYKEAFAQEKAHEAEQAPLPRPKRRAASGRKSA